METVQINTEVLKRMIEELKAYSFELGICDHSVNICRCGLTELITDGLRALKDPQQLKFDEEENRMIQRMVELEEHDDMLNEDLIDQAVTNEENKIESIYYNGRCGC